MDTERVTLIGGVQVDPTNDDQDPKQPLDPKAGTTRDKEPQPPEES